MIAKQLTKGDGPSFSAQHRDVSKIAQFAAVPSPITSTSSAKLSGALIERHQDH
jgi:hypothetical protein